MNQGNICPFESSCVQNVTDRGECTLHIEKFYMSCAYYKQAKKEHQERINRMFKLRR